jgi:hypothetical protein
MVQTMPESLILVVRLKMSRLERKSTVLVARRARL